MSAASGSHSTVSISRYTWAPNMKSEEWNSYRTRFLVKAKQLNSNLSFVDHLGRQHRGRKGDYLVESSDGVISIAPRRIFEDIYVPMQPFDDPLTGQTMIGLRRSSNPTSIKQMSRPASSSRESSCQQRSFEERSCGEASPALKMVRPTSPRKIDRMHFEALQIEKVKLGKPRARHRATCRNHLGAANVAGARCHPARSRPQ